MRCWIKSRNIRKEGVNNTVNSELNNEKKGLGNVLKLLRIAKELSIKELATQMSVSQS